MTKQLSDFSVYAQTRVRGCDAVQCDQGLSQQSKACSPPPTPTPTWSAWSQWGACSSVIPENNSSLARYQCSLTLFRSRTPDWRPDIVGRIGTMTLKTGYQYFSIQCGFKIRGTTKFHIVKCIEKGVNDNSKHVITSFRKGWNKIFWSFLVWKKNFGLFQLWHWVNYVI